MRVQFGIRGTSWVRTLMPRNVNDGYYVTAYTLDGGKSRPSVAGSVTTGEGSGGGYMPYHEASLTNGSYISPPCTNSSLSSGMDYWTCRRFTFGTWNIQASAATHSRYVANRFPGRATGGNSYLVAYDGKTYEGCDHSGGPPPWFRCDSVATDWYVHSFYTDNRWFWGRTAAWWSSTSEVIQCAIAVTERDPQGAGESCFETPVAPP